MLLQRIRIAVFELWMLAYMIYQAKLRFTFARMRRQGRAAEAEAMAQRMVVRLAHWVLDHLQCRLEVEGAEHVPRDEAFVIVSNHQGKHDISALVVAMDRGVGFVTKRELFRIPGLSFWMRQIHCLSIDRRDVEGSARAISALGAELKRTASPFVIFPEGTRTRDPERRVQPFKRGALRLASEHDLPVLPVSIDGTRLLDLPGPMRATRNGGRVVRLRIAPLRRLPANTAPARRAFMDELETTVRSNWEAIRVQWPHA